VFTEIVVCYDGKSVFPDKYLFFLGEYFVDCLFCKYTLVNDNSLLSGKYIKMCVFLPSVLTLIAIISFGDYDPFK
jgi:hypothetical protein